MIDKYFARKLGIRGTRLTLRLKGITDHEAVSVVSEKVSLKIRGESEEHSIVNAVLGDNLHFPVQSISKEIIRYVAKFASVFLQPQFGAQPKILIGQDNWRLLVTNEMRAIENTDLVASHTALGWALHGIARCATAVINNVIGHRNTDTPEEESLESLIRNYFTLEDDGIRGKSEVTTGNERALRILKETTRRVNNMWETGLLWKHDNPPKIDSRGTALKRLFSLEKKLDKNPEFAALYYAEMDRLFANGYAVESGEDEAYTRTWYLPHFGVTSTSKPGKIRLVFDAAAKSSGVSLNDQLDPGPVLIESLSGRLIRYRLYAIAFKADIRDMFLRILVRKEDRGALRFLWRGKKRTGQPVTYEMTRLIFGANSSPCEAIYVKNKNAKRFENSKPAAAKSIKEDSYVDDYLSSRPNLEEAKNLIRDVIEINSQANFTMHGWASNDVQVFHNAGDCVNKHSEMQLCSGGRERVLGLFWDTDTDMLGFKLGLDKIPEEILSGIKKPTKREFLRIIMSVFDPLGLLSPYTLQAKIIMQDVWRSGVGWDETLRDEEHRGWTKWMQNLKDVSTCRIHRCLTPKYKPFKNAQLHVFCDASLQAYAAAIYLRCEVPGELAHVALVMAKAKVAPLKPLSVPRLELLGALLGARLLGAVEKEITFQVSKRFCWSDSQTVVRWIKTEPRTKQMYVAERLKKINELTASSEWHWVPTRHNPADGATRWSRGAIDANVSWFEGPKFLRLPEAEWPEPKMLSEMERQNIDRLEIRKARAYVITGTREELPLTARLLGWRGLLVTGRWVFNCVNVWRKRARVDRFEVDSHAIENFWFREIQDDAFGDELRALKRRDSVKRSSKVANVCPYTDEIGIMRATGRVTRIEGVEFNNNPIILDGNHPVTRLLLTEYHRRFKHANHQTVINEVRQRFYVVGLRRALKSITTKCLICQLRRGKPNYSLMAPVPKARLAYQQRPFSHCGLEYFGPMQVKIGRRREKRWGVLFTCLTTRAVHLELAHSLSASSAIMAIQRLAARRGSPLNLYSDNGTNFRGACSELREKVDKIDRNKLREYTLRNGMRWIFNPPDAPHMGGAWERLIRSVKVALNAILNDQAPAEEVLLTVLTEIEHTINSRPLTHVSVDPRDAEALTPNHFLIGSSSGEMQLGDYDPSNISHRKQWRIAQAFADSFWKRWIREYLPTLIPRTKWFKDEAKLNVGDLVLIIDNQAPRNTWRKGKIVEIFPGTDKVVRVARINTTSGVYVRPLHKLIKLFSEEVQN